MLPFGAGHARLSPISPSSWVVFILFFFGFFWKIPGRCGASRLCERGSSWLNPPQKKGTGLGPRIKWLLHRDGWVGRDEDKENNATSHSPPPGLGLRLWSFPKSA